MPTLDIAALLKAAGPLGPFGVVAVIIAWWVFASKSRPAETALEARVGALEKKVGRLMKAIHKSDDHAGMAAVVKILDDNSN
ncbi:MAG: hypothetical protein D6773_04440 [Alphaproteobacteria bacterium]|nr:MAG: hypothetical protein D6773_04440 [Alphaproteobacteria bacterium]